MTTLVYHGTDQMDFARFDIAASRIYNVVLHFGTKAAAESRIAYLRGENTSVDFRILTRTI